MKRIVLMVIIGIIAVSSCYRDEIQNLQSQLDQIHNTQLASVAQQISAIQSTVNELLTTNSELDGYIQALRNQGTELERTISGMDSDIDELESQLGDSLTISSERMALLVSRLEDLHARLDGQGDSTSSELDEIMAQIDEIRNELSGMGDAGSAEEIANLVALLEELRVSMTAEQEGLRKTIDSLELEHSGLKDRVVALEGYIDNNLSDIDTVSGDMKDWIEATFSTIEQYDSTVMEITSIKVSIEALNKSMADMESRVKDELSAEIQEAVSSLSTSMQESLSSAVTDITDAYTAAISTAKSEIQAAYEASIAQSLNALEASMKEWVNGQLSGYWTISQAQQELASIKQEFSEQIAASQAYTENMVIGMHAVLIKEIDNNEALKRSLADQFHPMESEAVSQLFAITEKVDKNSLAIAGNSAMIRENVSDQNANSGLIEENSTLTSANGIYIQLSAEAMEELRTSLESENPSVLAQMELMMDNTSKIASRAELIARNAEQIETNRKQIASNADEIAGLYQSLETTKTEISSAYQEAITSVSNLTDKMEDFETAMEEIESSVSASIADFETRVKTMEGALEDIKNDIEEIKQAIYNLNTAIEEIQEQIKAIMGRIQSISYVPKYADGNAVMTYTNSGGTITPGSAVLDFELRPSSTAAEIAKVWEDALSVKAVYTLTRTVDFVSLAISSAEASTDGVLTVTVSGDALDESFFRSEQSANAALIISDGNNELSSEYVNLVPRTTDNIYVPDAGFKKYLLGEFDTDGDGEISFSEAEAVEKIDVSASLTSIKSLEGIEYFTNLTELDCSYNHIESLDLRSNKKLTKVNAAQNDLTSLQLEGCTALTWLDCSSNDLTVLDVSSLENMNHLNVSDNRLVFLNLSKNTALETLDCSNNSLKELNVSNNRVLTFLHCGGNAIAGLNLRYNTALTTLDCSSNPITLLDLDACTELANLNCSGNALRSLLLSNTEIQTLDCSGNSIYNVDVSACTGMQTFDCSSNELTNLDVSKCASLVSLDCSDNHLSSINVSANQSLTTLNCSGNPDLSAIWMSGESQQQNVELTTDTGDVFYNDGGLVIPDPALKSYLVQNYDYDGDGEISIMEADAITQVNCSGLDISDLSGLEACANLEYLDCSGNSISAIDLPGLTKLTRMVCYDNVLTDINLSGCTSLTSLEIMSSGINALNGTTLTIEGYGQSGSLTLSMANTQITSINVRGSQQLTSLDLTENSQLTSLDASGNTALQSLDVSTLIHLTSLDVHGCDLQAFDVTHNTELVTLICNDNSIPSLNVGNCPQLVTLECNKNSLTRIDVTKNPALQRLDLSDNTLSMTDFTSNPNLDFLDVSNNSALSILNVKNNPMLTKLNASGLAITALDLSANTALDSIDAGNNASLTSITIKNNPNHPYLAITDGTRFEDITIDIDTNTYLAVSGFTPVDDLVCMFKDEDGAVWYLNWNDTPEWVASIYCESIGMSLPTVEEAEEIAQRIFDIREALGITNGYSNQDFWTNESPKMNYGYFVNFTYSWEYSIAESSYREEIRYFAICIKP